MAKADNTKKPSRKANASAKRSAATPHPSSRAMVPDDIARALFESGFPYKVLGLPVGFGRKLRARSALAAEHAELSRKIGANLEAEWARIRGASGKSEPARSPTKKQDSPHAKQ